MRGGTAIDGSPSASPRQPSPSESGIQDGWH